ncbi:MAG: phage tail protein [Actinobacteria bacterium]|nr:phage tail protein [Actinomycetota bacterium]
MRGTVEGLINPHPLATALPAVYQGEGFTERFLSAFDDALAPVMSTLENLDAYLDPSLCPPDFLPWLAGWVGLELDENWTLAQQRRLVATTVELLQWRGTRRGLVELIQRFLGIGEDHIEVTDSGGVTWSVAPGSAPPVSTPPTLKVRVRVASPDEVDDRRLEHLVAASTPAHVTYEVEVVAS